MLYIQAPQATIQATVEAYKSNLDDFQKSLAVAFIQGLLCSKTLNQQSTSQTDQPATQD